jgi:hypothetical protein
MALYQGPVPQAEQGGRYAEKPGYSGPKTVRFGHIAVDSHKCT